MGSSDFAESVLNSRGFISFNKLFILRIIITLYAIQILFFSLETMKFSPEWLTAFTHHGYLALVFYFFFTTIVTAWKIIKVNDFGERYDKRDTLILSILQYIFSFSYVIVLFLDVVYWTLLAPLEDQHNLGNYVNINTHGINFVLLSIDFILARHKYKKKEVLIVCIYGIFYLIFHSIYYLLTQIWVYPFLDWNKKLAPLFYVLLPLAAATVFFIQYAASKLLARKLDKTIDEETITAQLDLEMD